MKFWYKFLIFPVFLLALTACEKDEVEEQSGATTNVEPYHSLDMKTDDGKVTQLLKHKIGNGIPIVIMGDGFVDKDIKEGKYRHATNKALEAIFSKHPLKSLKDYFDVYEVTAVSYYSFETFWNYPEYHSTFQTALNVGVGKENSDGDIFSKLSPGNNSKVVEYAEKVIGENQIDDATIVVVVNDFASGGVTTYPSYSTEAREIPTGCSIAYVSIMELPNSSTLLDSFSYAFINILLHEFGHAFAKLADEYVDTNIKDHNPEDLTWWQNTGYNRNVSLESDVTKTPWADFAADSRYDFEKLGCYEGAYYQEKGIYRPTDNSIMNSNGTVRFHCFNVASRVMIYKRCMNIAYGDSWTFNYEDFVKFDLEEAKAEHEESQKQHPLYSKSKRFCVPPVIATPQIRK
mgnify:CR=1 FL=1